MDLIMMARSFCASPRTAPIIALIVAAAFGCTPDAPSPLGPEPAVGLQAEINARPDSLYNRHIVLFKNDVQNRLNPPAISTTTLFKTEVIAPSGQS